MRQVIVIGAAIAATGMVAVHAQQTFTYASAGAPIESRTVTGAPYSAQFVSEHVQTLSDGNRIVRRTTGRIYRDADGRVRRETDRASGEPLVTISDPVAKTSTTLDPNTLTARSREALTIVGSRAIRDVVTVTRAASGSGSGRGSGSGSGGGGGSVGGGRGRAVASRDERTEEKLPEKTIEGVTATGIRRITTIAQGAIGNERPIQVVSEEWTSTALQVLVLTDLNDPRTGRSIYRLFAISRSNPPASLFEIPAGYTIVKVP